MIKALAITGPTASGKTALSLAVAKELGCEIISCDSMQIYREMNIGTAKATDKERREVPHHLIDFLDTKESFSAQDYVSAALVCAEGITERGHMPLFVGGTGLYLSSLTRAQTDGVPKSSPEYRDRILESVSTEEQREALHERLRRVDPISAAAIHPNNLRRVIRALEIYDTTGKPKSYFDELSRTARAPFSIENITLDAHRRELLYERIDRRVDAMIEEGLIDEVRGLYGRGMLPPDTTAAQAIGYKELIEAIEGKVGFDEAIAEIKQASRNYAKRQLTWWRADRSAHTLYIDRDSGELKSKSEITEECLSLARTLI